MATKTKQWSDGSSAAIQYDGQGDGEIIITSDPNEHYEARSMQITVETTNGSPKQTKTITINQAAKQRIDLSAAVVTAATQTYSGSAKTPTPTVTLNGSTVPSSGYDVAYSNNTNAGTATITITGKGDYTGTATGTFTINKASRTLSFVNSYMVLNTSSTGTKTATPSAGNGDGAITYSIANTTYATINSSTGAVTSKTSDGSVIVTATIAEGTNYLSASASYTLYVFATTHNYSYSGSVKNVTLPPGTYKLECWGAQGGSNGANLTYGITAKAGGKGGYSVGQLSIAQALAIQVLVGGQGSATTGGYNGGGGTQGTSQRDEGTTFGYSKMGGGGGASDIRLSDGSLYSRMIVAGGGSGGAMTYKSVTSSQQVTDNIAKSSIQFIGGYIGADNKLAAHTADTNSGYIVVDSKYIGGTCTCVATNPTMFVFLKSLPSVGDYLDFATGESTSNWTNMGGTKTKTVPEDARYLMVDYLARGNDYRPGVSFTYTSETTITATDYQVGYAGGGTTGDGYSNSEKGKQDSAGSLGGVFGEGGTQYAASYRYASGGGGGGWYGGGRRYSNDEIQMVRVSGGGSGFVNTAASAGNRPSGYTGLELDSGATYDGNTSFTAPGGGNETGHSGNGYVRITRIS